MWVGKGENMEFFRALSIFPWRVNHFSQVRFAFDPDFCDPFSWIESKRRRGIDCFRFAFDSEKIAKLRIFYRFFHPRARWKREAEAKRQWQRLVVECVVTSWSTINSLSPAAVINVSRFHSLTRYIWRVIYRSTLSAQCKQLTRKSIPVISRL